MFNFFNYHNVFHSDTVTYLSLTLNLFMLKYIIIFCAQKLGNMVTLVVITSVVIAIVYLAFDRIIDDIDRGPV